MLREGCIGNVRAVQSTFCEPSTPEAMPAWKRNRATGGGVLLDLASHHIDLTRWFLSDEVVSATAWIGSAQTDQDSVRRAVDA